MRRSDFFYALPNELIAQYPKSQRSASRLLCVDPQQQSIVDSTFACLIDLLKPNDLLVFNNTKVIPARLHGHKITGGKVEIMLERVLDSDQILAFLKANKSLKNGTVICLPEQAQAVIVERQHNLYQLQLALPCELDIYLERHGEIPLPPYIERQADDTDQDRYQTIYAQEKGAVAAPTAGLHFDEVTMQTLTAKNIQMAFITLHVGAGTFQPMHCDDINDHVMHKEYVVIDGVVCDAIQKAKSENGRVIAVGTTVVRALEYAASVNHYVVKPLRGETELFITPGFKFNVIDAMLTNFHLPESTLLMLVSAFAGKKLIFKSYQYAIEQQYRFFSYGDAMFIANQA